MTQVDRAARPGLRVQAAVLTAVVVAAAVAASSVAHASRADLSAFLERAEKMAVFNSAVRADIKVVRDGAAVDTAVLIVDPKANRQFFALKSSGWRALLPLDWGRGTAVAAKDGKPAAFDVDDALPTTDLRGMEFFPFWQTDYTTAFVSDSNRMEKTITLYARERLPYILFVITFDKEKLVPVLVKYYRENMNNLVRLRQDSNHVMVGSRPRPRKIEIRDFTENRAMTFELDWRTLDQVPPGLTEESGFHKASVDWPSDPVAAR